ncbi:hypothetical protein HMPREF1531_01173 [Propionibacterium sp. oral taxon 192 str. F0372]|uniref:CshA/CshB family fibrillar adhesin-related protein n=1 Tax=Propionibacterium sp. oral taxon 192 TaxID=671222 RepID=UPI0003534D70|nr:CshA/CshB family fibrillar adhesin-related protein [Propionibacterium sp. oral taxon 192]EPH03748.1 hypothetical protein HMPREF1531_01173 [Propionibacterium sp. oral taxon 192 str. F0372]
MGFRKLAAAVVCAGMACASAIVGASAQSQADDALPAVFATGGSGRFIDSIQWLQWADYAQFAGNPKPNVPVLNAKETKNFVNYRDMGEAGRLVTTCTLSDLKHLGHGEHLDNNHAGGPYPLTDEQAYGPLVATVPGAWAGDTLDNLYNIGGPGEWKGGKPVWENGMLYPKDYVNKNQMPIGLANGYAYNGAKTWDGGWWPEPGVSHQPTGYNSRVSVNLSCRAELRGTDGSVKNVPVSGLVVADAEASSKRSGTWDDANKVFHGEWSDEWVQAATTQPVTWRLLDRLRSDGCPTTATAKFMADGAMRLIPDGKECVYQNGGRYSRPNGLGGPNAVMFMEGATSATVTIQGAGYSAVALGLIIATDFGDAPKSYGTASSLFQPTWNQGEVTRDTDLFTIKQAYLDVKNGSPHLGNSLDAEGAQPYSDDALGDDNNDPQVDDEDGVNFPADGIRTAPGQNYSQVVACGGSGRVAGWVDWNHNGTFDSGEKSDEVPCPSTGKAKLTWKVPDDVVRSVAGEDGTGTETYARFRITNDSNALLPVGNTTTGEVEDYRVAVRVPTVQLTKKVDGAYAGDSALGVDQWNLTGKAGNTVKVQGAGSTGNPKAVGAGDLTLGEQSSHSDAAAYQAANWVCQQTPGTVGERFGSTVRNDDGQGNATLTIAGQDRVSCEITNTAKPGELIWKKVDVDGNKLGGSEWTLSGPGVPPATTVTDCTSAPCPAGAYADQNPSNGEFQLTGLKWGSYSVTESKSPAGYTAVQGSLSFDEVNAGRLSAGLTDGEHVVDNGVVNPRLTGQVSWSKTDADNNKPLSGSEWKLIAPGGQETIITDCTTGSCTGTGLHDEDPAPGRFTVGGLAWNQDQDYTLVESKAPAGYKLDKTRHTFRITVDADTGKVINHNFSAPFTNEKTEIPSIPLTGGTGAYIFLIGGGALGALAAGLQIWRRRRAQKN